MKELEGWTFKPYTSPKTNQIVKTKDMDIFQRLTQTTSKPKFWKRLDYKTPPQISIPPPNLSTSPTPSQAEDPIPQLFIDVHLDDQSIHRLTIYEEDDPSDLALNFCHKYSKNV